MAALTLAEVKAHLNITSSDHDSELGGFISRAEAAIAAKCGPLESTSVTVRVRGYGRSLAPKVTPILSLTSVTPVGGAALPLSTLHTPESGLHGPTTVERVDGQWFGSRWYDVTYSAGRTTVPEDLRLATLELLRLYWEDSQRGNSPAGALPGGGEDLQPVSEGRIPWAHIRSAIEPHEKAWL